ncbi:MAG: glutamine-hydrolyzing GMP synthase subunit GuaA [Hadesarchaea archaeon]|nr:glutamine-hydrolyzing GMP synthase subunit GuaA [Hadesarchaea archaeon]
MFDAKKFVREKVEWLKETIGNEKAFAAVSGGVDSTVAAMLAHMAIGNNLTVVFLDDGLMRAGEPQQVHNRLRQLGLNARIYRLWDDFFAALKGLTDPEEKRKAFREVFYRSLGKIAEELGAKFMIQGTIAADVVETKAGVKTQHNVLEQINVHPLERYGLRILEPLKDIYKHEVRAVAKALGMKPEAMRRPFPGPGLSIRVIGEVTPERVELVRRATKVVEEETKNIPCFQAFAVLLRDRATGVTKDLKRKYGEIVVVRTVKSKDAMTAEPVALPWKVLRRIERRIREENPSVTHVLYDLTGKPPATIEFE